MVEEEVLCMVKGGEGLMVSLLLFQTSHEVGSGEEEVLCMVKAGVGLMVSLLLFQTSHEVGSGEEEVYGESGSGTHGVLVVIVSDVP